MTDIEQALEYIDCSTLNYTEWIQVGMAIKEAGMGCDVWDAWSAKDSRRYTPNGCEKKWDSFNGSSQPITQAYIFKLAKDAGWRTYDGNDETLEWDGIIEYDGDRADKPKAEWNPVEDFRRYLQALFQPDEYISWVTEAKQDEDGKWKPAGKGCYWKTCAEVLKSLEKHPDDIGATIGDYSTEAGAWIRFNPVNGEGVNNSNVAAYRFALVESDTMALDAQYRMYRKLNLPIAAMVTSGGKSIHAIVHIDAANAAEYRDRVEMLYTILANKGMVVDMQNKNPSRLSRLPGCIRGTNKQMLVETNVGCANWEAWVKYNDSNTDDWPDIVPLSEALIDPPPLADVLIEGILRKGHKMLISGPSKAGKSFFLMELAVALANGEKWIGFQCRKSRVLYINFEIDSASCIHRFMDIRAALMENGADCSHSDDLMIWNLRGHAMPLNEMVPKITAKCKDFALDVILVDPIYKVLMGDENNASDMGAFCNEFDKIANLLHCSVIYCHHHSKGAQGFKKAMDRASGSGVFARDPDAQLDMLEIEPPDDYMDATTDTAWQIESSLREFPNIIPKRIWFRYPLHEEETDGELKHQPIADGSKGGRPSKISDEQIEQYFDQYAMNGFVNSRDMAAALEVSERSVRGYKSKKFEYVSRKGLRRVDGQ